MSKIVIPEVTDDKPYIEFRFSKDGTLSLKADNSWWGGIRSGFRSSDGSGGNTCRPKDLKKYIEAYKLRQIKEVEKEIKGLQKVLTKFKKQNQQWEL